MLEELEPETCLLTWDIRLPSETAVADIREVFEFVEDVCTLDIGPDSPPRSPRARRPRPCWRGHRRRRARAARQAPPAVDPVKAKPTSAGAGGAGQSEPAATVRVDLDRIDRLVNLVGELVINQAMLAQSVAQAGLPPNSDVMTGLEAFMMLTRDIQDSVMMIRAQPIKPLFQRMARIVREASGAIDKSVRLKTEGEATEIDKTVIERLADPLTHMIRNAVDHGLEPPADRLAAASPRKASSRCRRSTAPAGS